MTDWAPTITPTIVGLSLLFVAFVGSACGGEEVEQAVPTYDFTIEVEAIDREGHPVAGVPVLVDDNLVGHTDADGIFRAILHDEVGRWLHLAVDSPEGYRIAGNERQLETELQTTRGVDGAPRGLPVSLSVEFESVVFQHFVWVDVDCDDKLDDEHCAGLPVMLGDRELARTDARGFAHFSFEAVPGDVYDVSIETPTHDPDDDDSVKFEPASPRFEIELDAEPTVFHLAQEFTDPTVEDRRPRRRTRRTRRTTRPSSPSPTEADECDTGGVITLFGDDACQ